MSAAVASRSALLEQGLRRLASELGDSWEIAPKNVAQVMGGNRVTDADPDAVAIWTVRNAANPHGGYVELLVDARAGLTPGAATDVLASEVALMQRMSGQVAVLIISEWLSPRTREVLTNRGFCYLDLTGNVSLRLNQPAVIIRTDGAQQDPTPQRRGQRGLSGPKATRLARELVDFGPPRRAHELAERTGLTQGHLSRLLDAMSEQALIRRDADRLITDIDWANLLRAQAEGRRLTRVNQITATVARQGRARVLEVLREGGSEHRLLATGSFAAHAFAPLAVGGALMFYVPTGPRVVQDVISALALLPTDGSDADVLLLQPMNKGPWERPHPEPIDGIECVGLSQLVIDCLTGPGRMPAEGEALLTWMSDHTEDWRRPSPFTPDGPQPAQRRRP